ncbi:MAG: UrcA family protein [Novosphingobium sp.]
MTFNPALAQNGDIVVAGPYVELPDGRMLSSQVINYSDLDLGFSSDRLELRRRITSTARDVCNTLRRHSDYISLSNDCENGAISGALTQVRAAEGDWAVRP